MKYVIITPAKNEEKYIDHTLKSVINQSIRPYKWVIVDDGSTDSTRKIVSTYTENNDWIKLVRNDTNEMRGEGAPIIKAFYKGYEFINDIEWDFIVKLDADLTLPKDYFKSIINTFNNNKRVGITGGYISEYNSKGSIVKINHASYHIRGALKSIRRECWTEIGGFKPVLGWDGLDIMLALYYGWETKNIDSEVLHHRPTASDYNQKALAFKIGYSKFVNGSNIPLTILRAFKRINKKPYFIYSYHYLKGYFSALLNKEKRNVTKNQMEFINKFHLGRIFRADY